METKVKSRGKLFKGALAVAFMFTLLFGGFGLAFGNQNINKVYANTDEDYVATLVFEGNTSFHTSFDDAWNQAISKNTTESFYATITLLKSCSASSVLTNTEDTIMLNISTYTLNLGENYLQNSGGTLYVEGSGKITSAVNGGVHGVLTVSGGTLALYNATIEATADTNASIAVVVENNATFTMNSGSLESNNNYQSVALQVSGTSIIGIFEGTLISSATTLNMKSEEAQVDVSPRRGKTVEFKIVGSASRISNSIMSIYSNKFIKSGEGTLKISDTEASVGSLEPAIINGSISISQGTLIISSANSLDMYKSVNAPTLQTGAVIHSIVSGASSEDFTTKNSIAEILPQTERYAKIVVGDGNVTLTFDAEGGMISTSSKDIQLNATNVGLEIPTKDGFRFDGWYLGDNGTGTQLTGSNGILSVMNLTEDCKVYAKWTAISYQVNYEVNGGTALSSAEYYGKDSMTYDKDDFDLPTPNRANYSFVGWFAKIQDSGLSYYVGQDTFDYFNNMSLPMPANWEDDLSNPMYNSTNKITTVNCIQIIEFFNDNNCEITFTAKWEPNDFTITYINAVVGENGVTANSNPTTYTIETETITLADPIKTGYNFAGWTTTETITPTKNLTIPVGSTGDKTFTANWTIGTFTVRFTNCQTDGYVSYNYGTSVTAIPNIPIGNHFVGWEVSGVAGGTDNGESGYTFSMPANYVRVDCQYEINTYTVTYNAGTSTGGTIPSAVTKNYNEICGVDTTYPLTKNGYVQTGWTLDSEKYNQSIFLPFIGSDQGWQDVTLYPVFCTSYNMTYYKIKDGGTPTAFTPEHCKATYVETKGFGFDNWDFREDGYGVKGFYTDEACTQALNPSVITEDTTIYAVLVSYSSSGRGTENNPYMISTASQLNSYLCYDFDKSDIYVKLSNDITLDASYFTTGFTNVVYEYAFYSMDFDGNGHKITTHGLYLSIDDISNNAYVGLFTEAYDMEIRNLDLEVTALTLNLSSANCYVGSLLGSSVECLVENVKIKTNITLACASTVEHLSFGGLAGKFDGGSPDTINNCEVYSSTLVSSGVIDELYIGGVVGWLMDDKIINSLCLNTTLTLTGNANSETIITIGGLIGLGEYSNVVNCGVYNLNLNETNNVGQIYSSGIVGALDTGEIVNSYCFGSVLGTQTAGVSWTNNVNGIVNCYSNIIGIVGIGADAIVSTDGTAITNLKSLSATLNNGISNANAFLSSKYAGTTLTCKTWYPLTTAFYPQFTETYTIVWKNGETIIKTDECVIKNTMPTFNGALPIKPSTDTYKYEFNGWTPSIVNAIADATYTAIFTQKLINIESPSIDPTNPEDNDRIESEIDIPDGVQDNVVFIVKVKETSAINNKIIAPSGQEIVKSYNAKLLKNNVEYTSYTGTMTIKIATPVEMAGKQNIQIVIMDNATGAAVTKTATIDGDFLIFETNSLGDFAIVADAENSLLWLWILISCLGIGLIVLLVLWIFLYKRKITFILNEKKVGTAKYKKGETLNFPLNLARYKWFTDKEQTKLLTKQEMGWFGFKVYRTTESTTKNIDIQAKTKN